MLKAVRCALGVSPNASLNAAVMCAWLEKPAATDDHDRAFAHVYFDGADPTKILIDEGLAIPATGEPMNWCGPVSDAPQAARHVTMLSMAGS